MSAKKIKKAKHNKQQTAQPVKYSTELFFESKSKLMLYITLVVATLFSILLFDLKIGVGGDDAAYVTRAYDLVTQGKFPSFQGPLYPILLSVFVALFGINLPLLKALSFLFILTGIYFLYQSFYKRISAVVLHLSLFILSVNSMLLFYASQTYVEAFFFMLLTYAVFVFFQKGIELTNAITGDTWKSILFIAVLSFILGITKTIGWAYFVSVIVFWAIHRHWKLLSSFVAIHVMINGVWYLLKSSIWGYSKLQFSDQASTLLLRNPYVKSQGTEDVFSFLMRFWDNSLIYFSKHVYAFFGLRSILDPVNILLTLFVFVVIVVAFIGRQKVNKTLLFTGILLSFLLGVSFLVLQKIWDTPRLIVPFVPFLTLFIFGAIYDIRYEKFRSTIRVIIPLLLIGLFITTFTTTVKEVKKERTGLGDYIGGNKLKGYSPDWVNYISMCEWAAKNTPDSVMVAARKPSIAFLQTGKKFYGIYRIPMEAPETYFTDLVQSDRKYILVDETKLEKLKLPLNVILEWKKALDVLYIGSVGNGDKQQPKFYGVYLLETVEAIQLQQAMAKNGVEFITDAQILQQQLTSEKASMNVIRPKRLLSDLKDRNVKFVIMANLRKYENQKTKFTINTVRRYMFYLEHKYPGTLEQVSEVGADEKAFLFRINEKSRYDAK